MQLQKAARKRAKIRVCLQGASGSGKTYSSLLLAHGLCNDWSKIAVIDTENHSSELYSHLGAYYTLSISAPFSPEKYIEAISICEAANIEVIIIDSSTHLWDGPGGILDVHSSMSGNSFTNWGKLTPRYNAFIQAMLNSTSHIIATVRSKQEYVLSEKNGRQVPEKVGMKGVQRDGIDYEFTLVFEIDCKQQASATKDRTSLFINKPPVKLSQKEGKILSDWCNTDKEVFLSIDYFEEQINAAKSIDELTVLYRQNTDKQSSHYDHFIRRKEELQKLTLNQFSNTLKHQQNGTSTYVK